MILLGARSSLGQSTGLLSLSLRAITGKYVQQAAFARQQNQQVASCLVTVPRDSRSAVRTVAA